eukprot:7470316-Alexandrium_andersonii.AAC.1
MPRLRLGGARTVTYAAGIATRISVRDSVRCQGDWLTNWRRTRRAYGPSLALPVRETMKS